MIRSFKDKRTGNLLEGSRIARIDIRLQRQSRKKLLRRINEIVLGKRAITADTAIRLGRALGTSARFWMNLEADYDLRKAEPAVGEVSRVA